MLFLLAFSSQSQVHFSSALNSLPFWVLTVQAQMLSFKLLLNLHFHSQVGPKRREPIPLRVWTIIRMALLIPENVWPALDNELGNRGNCWTSSITSFIISPLFAMFVALCVTRFRIRPRPPVCPSDVLLTSLPCVPHFSGRRAPFVPPSHGKTQGDR